MEALHQSDSALLKFPNEILVEIMKDLDWHDLFEVRKTCKVLYDVSQAKEVWASLFRRIPSELDVPPVLEQPLSSYTAAELESRYLRRISSEVRWANTEDPNRTPFGLRKEELSDEDDLNTVLLDGGRWLLVMLHKEGHYGRVYALDMDREGPKSMECILNLGIDQYLGPMWHMAADMVPDLDYASALTFNLCLTPQTAFETDEPLPDPDGPSEGIHIYRLTVKGHGNDAVLDVQKIKSIRDLSPVLEVYNVILRGDYLVRCIDMAEPNDESFRFEVFNWVLSNNSTHVKGCIDGVHNSEDLDSDLLLIPDGKIVVFSKEISIYDITNLSSISVSANEPSILQPYDCFRNLTFSRQLHFSRSCRDATESRATVILDHAVYGFRIPHDIKDENGPWYYRTSNYRIPDTEFACVGINKIYFYTEKNGEGTVTTMALVWDEQRVDFYAYADFLWVPYEQYTRRQFSLAYLWNDLPLFDESSNCVFTFGDDCWILIDFAYIGNK